MSAPSSTRQLGSMSTYVCLQGVPPACMMVKSLHHQHQHQCQHPSVPNATARHLHANLQQWHAGSSPSKQRKR